MNRRIFFKTSVLMTGSSLLLCAYRFKTNKQVDFQNLHYLEKDIDKKVYLEGEILHVCPIGKQKMKLRLADGEIVRVLPLNDESFNSELWNRKKVKISGKLEEMRLERSEIASVYKEKKLLCHIDHTPCLDNNWIENRWKDGSALQILSKDNEKNLQTMHETKQGFIRIFSIYAEEIAEI